MHRYHSSRNKLRRLKYHFGHGGLSQVSRALIAFIKFKFRSFFAPVYVYIKKTLPDQTFSIAGNEYRYFYHEKNHTWTNERAVEIAVILKFLKDIKGKKILEVGAVMGHYIRPDWEIIDKFEVGPGIQNIDIEDFTTDERYDLIFSISTLEHVGLDDEIPDPYKVVRAHDNIMNLLKSGGIFLLTVPLGYNGFLDQLIYANAFNHGSRYFIRKITRSNRWKEVEKARVINANYGGRYDGAEALYIGIVQR